MGRKIVSLQVENIKRLKAIRITPDGTGVVIVGGNNAQGKSSVLDAIWLALGGRAASAATVRPVRDGEEAAMVRLDLGDLIVTRKWKGDKSTLTVESADGAKYSSPQSILDKLVGKLAFDPLAFATWDAKKQREVLMGLVELPFDPDELDAKRKGLFDQRTDVNRQLKQLDGQLAGMIPAPAGTPDEEVSVSELLEQYRAAQEQNRLTRVIANDVESNKLRITQLREQLAQAEADLEGNLAALAARPPQIDLFALESKLDDVDNINANVRAKLERQAKLAERASTEERADRLTAEIEQLDTTKAKGLADAVYPITGLGFDDTGVVYNGVPFQQASSAEQLRISTAMGMALNPELRVMHIRDGSLLDANSLDLVSRMAEANDFQIWIERVGTNDEGAVIIEDGEVAA
ncbi:DNA repair protein [Arthrobacter phage Mufasa8]|uniref:DNA repair protein n=1 Tax=Arthrobacter phage Mufasa8 TaxID=2656526 RepID=A0A649VMN2_9CAUD|nr:DNA repair protein [Arthrobacter phage Mufasa8]QGJ93491.1 DNA repair protein [Arthrobacter phage Mufasa8]